MLRHDRKSKGWQATIMLGEKTQGKQDGERKAGRSHPTRAKSPTETRTKLSSGLSVVSRMMGSVSSGKAKYFQEL